MPPAPQDTVPQPAPAPVITAPQGRSVWFYIGITAVVIVFVLILAVVGRFTYLEIQLHQDRQQAQAAIQQEQTHYQQIQAYINTSENPTPTTQN